MRVLGAKAPGAGKIFCWGVFIHGGAYALPPSFLFLFFFVGGSFFLFPFFIIYFSFFFLFIYREVGGPPYVHIISSTYIYIYIYTHFTYSVLWSYSDFVMSIHTC